MKYSSQYSLILTVTLEPWTIKKSLHGGVKVIKVSATQPQNAKTEMIAFMN